MRKTKNMQKKNVALLASVFLMTMLLIGCGNSEEQSTRMVPGNKVNQEATKPGEKNKDGKALTMPTEAISACSGKAEADACEMTLATKEGETATDATRKMSGTCKKTQDNQLACMPAGGSPNGKGGGPRGEKPADSVTETTATTNE